MNRGIMLMILALLSPSWAEAQESVSGRPAGSVGVSPESGGVSVVGGGGAVRLPAQFTFNVPVSVSNLHPDITSAGIQCLLYSADDTVHCSMGCNATSSTYIPQAAFSPVNGHYTGTLTLSGNCPGVNPAIFVRWECRLYFAMPPDYDEARYGTCTGGWCAPSTDPSTDPRMRVQPGSALTVSGRYPELAP